MKRFVVLMVVGSMFVACGGDGGPTATAPAGGAGLDLAECSATAQAMAAAAAAVPQAVTGAGGDIQQAVDQLQAATNVAPDEIKADLQTVTDGYVLVADILAGADVQPGQVPSAEVLQQLSAAAEEINTEEFQAAADRVGEWFLNECGQ